MTRVSYLFCAAALALVGCGESAESDGTKAQLSVSGEEVSCTVGTGSGTAPAPAEEDAELSCDHDFSDCTDGHTYQAVCTSTQGSGTMECDCYVDAQPVGDGPVQLDGECPAEQAEVLAGCGWAG